MTPDTSAEQPIYSTLATSSSRFVAIIESFLEKLDKQIVVMHDTLNSEDWTELFALGHWLKGSGGTCGFAVTYDPAFALEEAAKAKDKQAAVQAIADIERIRPRLMIDTRETNCSQSEKAGNVVPITNSESVLSNTDSGVDTPITSSLLAGNPKFRPIVEKFIPRLQEQVSAMDTAMSEENFTAIAEIAHWLKGSGGNVGFDGFTERSLKLEMAAKASNKDQTEMELSEVRRYASRVIEGWQDQSPERVSA